MKKEQFLKSNCIFYLINSIIFNKRIKTRCIIASALLKIKFNIKFDDFNYINRIIFLFRVFVFKIIKHAKLRIAIFNIKISNRRYYNIDIN